ncbi:hypothetical protein GCM10009855_08370 [Gordonia cholesterolivorans]|uniref:Uncharacterized protein n=1 Tax=Gordonia cholesterolivorans TaxID=559625 RepID=A0ABP5U6R2_9ACTN
MGGIVDFDVHHSHARDRVDVGEHRAVDRVGLEHGQRVEEGAETRRPLDIGESGVVVVEQVGLLDLHPAQEIADRFGAVEPNPDRNGVDEETDGGFHARQLRRPAGDRGAEHDVRATGQAGQEHTPRGLHHGVHRDTERPGGGGERRLDILVEVQKKFLGRRHRELARLRGEDGRLVEAGEGPRPRVQRGLRVLARQPVEIGAVTRRGGHARAVAVGAVQRQKVGQHQRQRPAVQQEVVIGQRQTVRAVREADQPHPDQRRPVETEASLPIRRDQIARRPLRLLLVEV